MGGACSRKRDLLDEDDLRRSGRYSKSGSSKWLLLMLPRCSTDVTAGRQGKCPSLMELCVAKVREVRRCYTRIVYVATSVVLETLSYYVKSIWVKAGYKKVYQLFHASKRP